MVAVRQGIGEIMTRTGRFIATDETMREAARHWVRWSFIGTARYGQPPLRLPVTSQKKVIMLRRLRSEDGEPDPWGLVQSVHDMNQKRRLVAVWHEEAIRCVEALEITDQQEG